MKILNAEQIRHVDRITIVKQEIDSIDLMEKAARKCLQWFEKQDFIDENNLIHIFCGMGNNGGDGLALARMLSLEFYQIAVYTVHFSDKMSDDFITNYNRLEEYEIRPISIHSEDDFPVFKETDIIVDAVFGSGLTKPPSGFTKKLIQHINASGLMTISLDIPSGMPVDQPIIDRDAVVKAQVVLSFQLPKLNFLLPDNGDYIQYFEVLDIELDQEVIAEQQTDMFFTMREDVIKFFKKRKKFSHKGTYGHALIIGGSFGKMGSVVLATKAALKSGSGLVTAYIPKCGYQILQTTVPEAMVEVDAENELEFFNFKTEADVLGIGVGLGTSEQTAQTLYTFLETDTHPKVLDADALNLISRNKGVFRFLDENCILTPHPKELERLMGTWENDYDKLEKVKKLTLEYPFVLVLKGAHTLVAQKGLFYFNSTGNPALAKAGAGDVLTGIITGLLAQKYTPLQAAIMGVYLHGLSADVFTALNAPETFLAGEIINFLPGAFNTMLNPYEDKEDAPDEDVDMRDGSFLDDQDDDI